MLLSLLVLSSCLVAQEKERVKAEDWPLHTTLKTASLGVEYMIHSVIVPGNSVLLDQYLVVEVGFYPAKDRTVTLSQQHFQLRVNGKKQLLFPQTPGMVAASVQYPDWEQRRTMTGSAGAGNGGIILGRPQSTERFPGDPRPRQERLPPSPRVPGPEDQSGVQKEVKERPEEVVLSKALWEGAADTPVRGFIYYAYKGKASSVKKLELIYSSPAGEATLNLQ